MRSTSSSEIETCGAGRAASRTRTCCQAATVPAWSPAASQIRPSRWSASGSSRLSLRVISIQRLARIEIFRGEREIGEVECELRIVDHRRRQLGEGLARVIRIAGREQRLGAHDHGLDQVGFLVDEVERGLDHLERALGISLILQQDPGDAHPRHRVVGA